MSKILTNRWVHFLVLFVLLMSAFLFSGRDFDWKTRMQNLVFDLYMNHKPRPAGDQIVIADIDELSLNKIGQWPWPRTVTAQLVENLTSLGAKVIAFDMVFEAPDRTSPAQVLKRIPDAVLNEEMRARLESLPDHDLAFADAIKESKRVITAFVESEQSAATEKAPRLRMPIAMKKEAKQHLEQQAARMQGILGNLPEIAKASAGNGSFTVHPGVDGIVRKVPMILSYQEPGKSRVNFYPALSLETLRVAFGGRAPLKLGVQEEGTTGFSSPMEILIGKQGLHVPLDYNAMFWVYFRHLSRDKEYIPVYKILDPAFHDEVADRIKDKIVLVGTSAQALKDLRSTPIDEFLPGVEVHFNIIEQVMQQVFLSRPEHLLVYESLAILVGGLFIILVAPFIGAIFMAALTVLAIGGAFMGSWIAFSEYGFLIDPLYPSFCLAGLFMVSSLLTYARSESERREIRQAFGLYVSPDVMKEIEGDNKKLQLGGELRDLSVMFTDIRGFTTISERLTPEELITLMNDFLTPMSDLVMDNRGTIDKYMGDAMMAFWNAPVDVSDHARRACLAALGMKGALEPINENLRKIGEKEGREPLVLNAGIGINTGPCSVGNMGSRKRFAYSALGDTVNLASRLESQTKSYGVDILIGENTRREAPEFAALELDLLRVKGKTQPVRIFTLVGDADVAGSAAFKTWAARHEEMMTAYRAAAFDKALDLIAECRTLADGRLDGFYTLYAERIAGLKAELPGPDWDGVFTATSK